MQAIVQTGVPTQRKQSTEWFKAFLWSFLLVAAAMVLMVDPAWATGTGTGTAAGGAGAAQTRINAVATGWQNIVQGIGVVVLVIAWSFIGYMIAFNGKSMKDMVNPMLGSTIAGLAPILVGWMFS